MHSCTVSTFFYCTLKKFQRIYILSFFHMYSSLIFSKYIILTYFLFLLSYQFWSENHNKNTFVNCFKDKKNFFLNLKCYSNAMRPQTLSRNHSNVLDALLSQKVLGIALIFQWWLISWQKHFSALLDFGKEGWTLALLVFSMRYYYVYSLLVPPNIRLVSVQFICFDLTVNLVVSAIWNSVL